jgi:hypothetical protein
MKNIRIAKAALAAAIVGAGAILGTAQIERLNLEQMVAKTDDAVIGEITKTEVIRIDHPVDGPELYYTHLTVKGRSLESGQSKTVVVTFPGGFIDDEHGVWNSEAPSADDIKVGNQVISFFKWSENMGGDLAANALYASHGGLFRTAESRNGTVVLGRGDGYAIAHNIKLNQLDSQITEIAEAQGKLEKSNK